MFDLLKKNKTKKEETEQMTQDEKEIEKAKRDIAEDGKDSQTEKDRIDESVGEQQKRSGDTNSQSAKDRVDESEGAKKADEKRAEVKKEEKSDEREDGLSDRILTAINTAVQAAVEKAVGSAVDKAFNAMDRQSKEASSTKKEELTKIENIYN